MISWNYLKSINDLIYYWSIDDLNKLNKNDNNIKLIDVCNWPNCNKSCPKLKHPDSDKYINPLEYFNYFGLVNFKSLSYQLKLKEHSIRKVNYPKLMKRLLI